MKIKQISAIEILDSRGNPTVKAYVKLSDDSIHASSVPSGASTGAHEAIELRDGDNKRYSGLGCLKAVNNVNTVIAKALVGKDIEDLDNNEKALLELDQTENKSQLGANAILGVSMSLVKCAAYIKQMPLWQFINSHYFSDTKIKPSFPRLMVNVINGGKHANFNFDIQEFMIIPKANSPKESIRTAAEIFHRLGKNLKKDGLSCLVGDEGGYSPALNGNTQVFEKIIEAGNDALYENIKDYDLAVDCAATEFFDGNNYTLKKTGESKNAIELTEYYMELQNTFKLISYEDPFHEDDWEAFANFTKLGKKNGFQVVGDDLFVTNPKRISQGVSSSSASSVLIKLNQIGSVSETIKAIKLAKENSLTTAISHRSGETDDTFISDLSFGVAADFLKAGSMCRFERLAKYNRLLEIQESIINNI